MKKLKQSFLWLSLLFSFSEISWGAIVEKDSKGVGLTLASDGQLQDSDIDQMIACARVMKKYVDKRVPVPVAGLDFTNSQMGDNHLKRLAENLSKFPDLTELNLKNCNIGDRGAIALAESLKDCTHLKTVNLTDNSIQNKGAGALKEILKDHTFLEILGLSDNQSTVASKEDIFWEIVDNPNIDEDENSMSWELF